MYRDPPRAPSHHRSPSIDNPRTLSAQTACGHFFSSTLRGGASSKGNESSMCVTGTGSTAAHPTGRKDCRHPARQEMPSTQIPNTKQTEERLNSLAPRSEGMGLVPHGTRNPQGGRQPKRLPTALNKESAAAGIARSGSHDAPFNLVEADARDRDRPIEAEPIAPLMGPLWSDESRGTIGALRSFQKRTALHPPPEDPRTDVFARKLD